MNRQQYEEDMTALRQEVPELLTDIRQYAMYARIRGDHAAVERAESMAEFVEEIFFDLLHPFAPKFSEN